MHASGRGRSAADRAAIARAALEEAERLARSRSRDGSPDAEPQPGAPSRRRFDDRATSRATGRSWSAAAATAAAAATDADDERGPRDRDERTVAGRGSGADDGERVASRGRSSGGGRSGRGGSRGRSGGSDGAPEWTDGNRRGRSAGGPEADPQQVARTICLRLLTVQPRTRAELAAALAKRNVSAEAADAVLDRFSEVGLIDDAAFARAWVESRQRGRGLGRSALAGELRKKGVDREIAQEALDLVDADDDLEAAQRLVAKKLPSTRGLPPDKRARRLVGMLARRGHPAGLAYRVVRDALAAEGTDPDLAGVPDPTLTDD